MDRDTIMFTSPEKVQDKTIEMILQQVYHALEEKGRIYVLRPEEEAIGRMEKKCEVLEGFYEHGYHLMERDFDKMTEYLGK